MENKLRMQYLGILNFLCEQSPYFIQSNPNAKETFERILDDACAIIDGLKWKQVFNTYEIYIDMN